MCVCVRERERERESARTYVSFRFHPKMRFDINLFFLLLLRVQRNMLNAIKTKKIRQCFLKTMNRVDIRIKKCSIGLSCKGANYYILPVGNLDNKNTVQKYSPPSLSAVSVRLG